jgi:glutamate/tyrosine decarboxylase-like PLP-dependent enzyme
METDDQTNPFDEVAAALDHAHARSREFIVALPDRPVGTRVTASEMRRRFEAPLPERGCSPEEALDEWLQRADPGITASPGPRFFGFVTGGSTPAGVAADWLASTIDQNAGIWASSPAAASTDEAAIKWLKELFDLPAAWAGSMTSGATMANLVGLAAARQWASLKLGFDAANDGLAGNPRIPVISSTEIHASAKKALNILGFGRSSVWLLPAPGARLDLNALSAELASSEGPAIVIANAGDVNTGAFDDLAALVDRCDAHSGGVWVHVDSAFGLFARLSPRTAHLLNGIDRVDSVASDAHKWLNVPYGCGFAFVRDEAVLTSVFASQAAYLAPPPGSGRDSDSYGPEMSQRMRSLSVWCALRAFGRDGYRDLVERCLDNAATFAQWIVATPQIELVAPAHLNIVSFRYVPKDSSPEETDRFNRQAVLEIKRDGRVFVTPTVWDGKAAIRAAFDNWTTTASDVETLKETVRDMGQRLAANESKRFATT